MLNEVKRMQKLAGIINESALGAAYAERELDGDASRQMHESEVDFLDLKTGQDVWVKSKKKWAVITDLDGPSSDDAGENTFIIVKLRNGEEIEVPLADIEIDDSTDDGEGDHYGDEEDDLSYYTRRGWKSSLEESMFDDDDYDPLAFINSELRQNILDLLNQEKDVSKDDLKDMLDGDTDKVDESIDPSEKINKLVGLEEGPKSDFQKFMDAMSDLYDLSNSGFILPEEWKIIFPVYTEIYSRAKQMDVSNFKNDK